MNRRATLLSLAPAAMLLIAVSPTEEEFKRMRAENRVAEIRQHAWRVVHSITDRWRTWPNREAVKTGDRTSVQPVYHLPLQLFPEAHWSDPADFSHWLDPRPTTISGQPPLTETRYNWSAFRHIVENELQTLQGIKRSNRDGVVEDFENDAIVVKAVWWPVRVTDDHPYSPLPVWDGFVASDAAGRPRTGRYAHDYRHWPRIVAVSRTAPADPDQHVDLTFVDPDRPARDTLRRARVVSLDRFFHVDVDPAHLSPSLDDVGTRLFGCRGLRRGDKLVLVGLHVMTRDVEDWFWATFWWHDRALELDPADHPPGLDPRWTNYRVQATLDDQTVVLNPWLELPLSGGETSNCIACHRQAAVRANGLVGPIRTGLGADPTYGRGKIRTRFLWSLSTLAAEAE